MAEYQAMTREELEEELRVQQAAFAAFQKKGLKLDMSRGKPSPEQLNLSDGMLDCREFKGESGVDSRNYGNLEGMPEARAFFAEMLGSKPEEVFVGGNSSLNMMYCMVDLGARLGYPGGKGSWLADKPKFLCPAPGYDRHFRVTEYLGFELVTVPMLPTGPDMDMVEELVQDERVKGIWCVPLYSNPDGYSYSDETVRRLAKMKTAAPDFRIFWDNAYCVHHVREKHDVVLNILDECRAAGCENRPLMFCSLSKVTYPGASVAAMAASKENIDFILKNTFPMLISFDKMNQMRHVWFLKDMKGVEAHMERHRAIIEPKFDAVLEALENDLKPAGVARWTNPNGGYFLSLYTMNGCAKRTVELCKQAGVVLTPAGAAYPYGIDPHDHHLRIAPTYPSLEELEQAATLLCICVRIATLEKLLAK